MNVCLLIGATPCCMYGLSIYLFGVLMFFLPTWIHSLYSRDHCALSFLCQRLWGLSETWSLFGLNPLWWVEWQRPQKICPWPTPTQKLWIWLYLEKKSLQMQFSWGSPFPFKVIIDQAGLLSPKSMTVLLFSVCYICSLGGVSPSFSACSGFNWVFYMILSYLLS